MIRNHESHSKAYNDNLEIEIETLKWTLEQIQASRKVGLYILRFEYYFLLLLLHLLLNLLRRRHRHRYPLHCLYCRRVVFRTAVIYTNYNY
jgi:hypothetical protein